MSAAVPANQGVVLIPARVAWEKISFAVVCKTHSRPSRERYNRERLVVNYTKLHMMGYGYGMYGGMMGGVSVLGIITYLVVIVDAVLLGIWLWQHISKK